MNRMIRKISFALLILYTLLLSFWMLIGFNRYTYPDFRYNLIPFSTIKHFLQFDRFNTNIWVINLLGNIAVFMPFGLLLPVLFRGRFMRSFSVFIIALTVLELSQFLTRRGSLDIDDFILNSVGFLLGFGVYKIFVRLFKVS